jgi:hypothetical protein
MHPRPPPPPPPGQACKAAAYHQIRPHAPDIARPLSAPQYAPPGAPVKQLPTTKAETIGSKALLAADQSGAVDPYGLRPLSEATPPPATRQIPLTICGCPRHAAPPAAIPVPRLTPPCMHAIPSP